MSAYWLLTTVNNEKGLAVSSSDGRSRGLGWFCRLVMLLVRQDSGIRRQSLRQFAATISQRMRMLWTSGRPVLFLTALCMAVGVVFSWVSLELGTGFFLAGFGALLVALCFLAPVSDSWAD
jgi:hypothetical protein